MKTSLPTLLRNLVLLALAPSPLIGCGAHVVFDGGAGGATNGVSAGAGEAGSCAPSWVTGDATSGGEVLLPLRPPSAPVINGQTSFALCSEYCMGSMNFNACIVVGDGGYQGPAFSDPETGTESVLVSCMHDQTGRRPAGLLPWADPGARSLGELLARAAYLEAASVDAFLDLAVQVEAHGAPAALVDRLRRAARDEVRHARDVGALARARGAEPPRVTVMETGPRSLLSLALENAREGCVRETWGAACAVAEGERAEDPELRRAMRLIARDELEHAALSWDLAAWIAPRLSADERAAVEVERARAVAELENEIDGAMPEPWARALGVPSPRQARTLFASMHAAVWDGRAVA